MTTGTTAGDPDQRSASRRVPWGVLIAMPLYSVLAFSSLDDRVGLAGAMTAVVLLYPLVIYVYYGVARMVFEQQYLPLGVGAAIAVATALAVSHLSDLQSVVVSWAMLLGAGAMIGGMPRAGARLGRAYTVALVFVAIAGVAQWLPVWAQAIQHAPESIESVTPGFTDAIKSIGTPENQVGAELDQFKRMMMFVIRLSPAAMLMNLFIQLSVATLLFARWLVQTDAFWTQPPFMYWKMPFAVTPLLVIAIILRFTGQTALVLVADNTLMILSVFYCLTGLALCEFYLNKFGLKRWRKAAFYLLLLLSQFIGYVVTAILGFVDSFMDWRRVQLRKITG